MEAVIDTNVLVYAAFSDQAEHEEAISLLGGLKGWYIPTIAILEFLWFLRGAGVRWKEARRLLLGLLSRDEVEVVPTTAEDLMDAVIRSEDPGEVEDEAILAAAERLFLPVATFDGDMANKARARGLGVVGPGEG